MTDEKLTRAERRRRVKAAKRLATDPGSAKGARKRRAIAAAMIAAAEEAALKLRAKCLMKESKP